MNKMEKIMAFTMRVDGSTYQEIGEKLGYSRQNVYDALKRVLTDKSTAMRCVYPAVSRWMEQHRVTGLELSKRMCYSYSTIYAYLSGREEPSIYFKNSLEKITGIRKDVLFRRKSE